MADNLKGKKVLVTGASGFIASHCVIQLLEQGYHVRGTLRNLERADSIREIVSPHVYPEERLEFIQTNLTSDENWDKATEGCEHILHVASPVPITPPKNPDEIIIPARDGTLRVLRAALKSGAKRVVLTSSLAAVCSGYDPKEEKKIYNEENWTIVDSKYTSPYAKSKTLAEKAAWEFMEKEAKEQMELAVINPGAVLGPVLEKDYGSSGEIIRKIMDGEMPGCPNLGWSIVDVRDVAAAHLAAMEIPEAAGKRFCCSNEHFWIYDIAVILKEHLKGKKYKISTRKLPNFLVKLSSFFDENIRSVIMELDHREDISNERIKKVLNWKPRTPKEAIIATAESLIEHGVV